MPNRLTDFFTFFYHRTLGVPVKLKKVLDYKPVGYTDTVVFLHGISTDSASTWNKTFNKLQQDPLLQPARLIALDLLGFGKSAQSSWLSYNYDEYLQALSAALKKYHIKIPIILVGHSMGALIAAKYAEQHRERVKQLILVSPPLLMPSDVADVPDKFYIKTYGSLHNLYNNPIIRTIAGFVQAASSFRKKYLGSAPFARSMEHVILNPHNYDTFKNLSVPTVIIHGRADPLVYGPNLTKVSKENRHIKLTVTTSGHNVTARKDVLIARNIAKALK